MCPSKLLKFSVVVIAVLKRIAAKTIVVREVRSNRTKSKLRHQLQKPPQLPRLARK